MANFKTTIITQKGHALIAKLEAGTATSNFKKICTTDYDYSSLSNSQLEELTSIRDTKQTILPDKISVINKATVKVSGTLTNTELKTGYYIRTIALYAVDPDEGEILYSITPSTLSDFIPPNNGVTSSGVIIDLLTTVSNAENVSIDVDPNAIVSIQTFNDFKEEVNSQLNDIANSGYFDIAKDMKGADYKTIKENGFYRNVTGTPTTGTGGVLLVISNTDKWSVAYKWLSISNTVITEYNACKDGDNYEEWKEISTNDTGWLNLPLSSGVVVDSGLTPQYRKIGNRVFIRGSVKNIVSGNSVIGTLPVGFRPLLQNHHYATFTNTNACASFNISTDGRIIYQGNSTNTFNAEWFVVITNNFII